MGSVNEPSPDPIDQIIYPRDSCVRISQCAAKETRHEPADKCVEIVLETVAPAIYPAIEDAETATYDC
jgi:hypothetical protein